MPGDRPASSRPSVRRAVGSSGSTISERHRCRSLPYDPDPAGRHEIDAQQNSPAPPLRRSPSVGLWLVLIGAVLLGLALRVGHAWELRDEAFEWEADGFVVAWEGRSLESWNRLRPPGLGLVMTGLREALGLETVLLVRLACVALSLLGLLAAVDLARALSRATGLGRRSLVGAAAFAALVWAVHPTLLRQAVTPTPELVVGPLACLALSRLVVFGARPGVWSWLVLALAVVGVCLGGGLAVVLALMVGVLVDLLPVPRFSVAVAPLALLLVGLAAFGWIQSGGGLQRPWLPDTAGLHSVAALLELDPPHPDDIPAAADRREILHLQALRRGVAGVDPWFAGRALFERIRRDALGPGRLEPLLAFKQAPSGVLLPEVEPAPPPPVSNDLLLALGYWDLFLRGGSVLFSLTVLGLMRRREHHSTLPRAAVTIAILLYGLLSVCFAIGPLSLSTVDLLLLGVAAGGVAGGDPRQLWLRRLAFAVGGILTCTLLYTAGLKLEPLSRWTAELSHVAREGRQLVRLLDTPDPGDVVAEVRIAELLMRPTSPLLRMPEAALTHALQATQLLPTHDDTLEVFVRAQVEAGNFRDAARGAEGGVALHPAGTLQAKRWELMLDWVRQEERMAAGLFPGR